MTPLRERPLRWLLTTACVLSLTQPTGAESPDQWQDAKAPAQGRAEAIGGYSAGCVRGARPLPLSGKHHRVTRPERRRHFGHPVLLDYLQELARRADMAGVGKVFIGDLSQPRGGPAPNGHSSHQTGLDVDIWYRATKAPAKVRDSLEVPLTALSVVDRRRKALNRHWTPKVAELLRMAASDARVARIFVNPVIKQELCKTVEGDRTFLSRLRPWYGHDDHFHVRMECPANSPLCKPQPPPSKEDGCDKLAYWLSDREQAARKRGQKRYQSTVGAKPPLPEACMAVLSAGPAKIARAP